MKKMLLAFVMMFLAGFAGAADKPPMTTLNGKVLEVKDVEIYTYLRLKTKDGEAGAAVSKAPV